MRWYDTCNRPRHLHVHLDISTPPTLNSPFPVAVPCRAPAPANPLVPGPGALLSNSSKSCQPSFPQSALRRSNREGEGGARSAWGSDRDPERDGDDDGESRDSPFLLLLLLLLLPLLLLLLLWLAEVADEDDRVRWREPLLSPWLAPPPPPSLLPTSPLPFFRPDVDLLAALASPVLFSFSGSLVLREILLLPTMLVLVLSLVLSWLLLPLMLLLLSSLLPSKSSESSPKAVDFLSLLRSRLHWLARGKMGNKLFLKSGGDRCVVYRSRYSSSKEDVEAEGGR